MDKAFHDCFAQCWLCNHAALSLRNKESKMTPVQSGHGRQSEKHHIHFFGWQPPRTDGCHQFSYLFSKKTDGHVFSIMDAIVPPTEETLHPALYPTAAS